MRFLNYFIFFLFGVVALGVYNIKNDSPKGEVVVEENLVVDSTAKKELLIEHYSMVSQSARPSGLYEASFKHNGEDLKFSYYFSNDSFLTKDFSSSRKFLFLNLDTHITGKSRYQINQSVISYFNIEGEHFIFDAVGEPLVINSDGSIDTYFRLPSEKFEMVKVNLKKSDFIRDIQKQKQSQPSKGLGLTVKNEPESFLAFSLPFIVIFLLGAVVFEVLRFVWRKIKR